MHPHAYFLVYLCADRHTSTWFSLAEAGSSYDLFRSTGSVFHHTQHRRRPAASVARPASAASVGSAVTPLAGAVSQKGHSFSLGLRLPICGSGAAGPRHPEPRYLGLGFCRVSGFTHQNFMSGKVTAIPLASWLVCSCVYGGHHVAADIPPLGPSCRSSPGAPPWPSPAAFSLPSASLQEPEPGHAPSQLPLARLYPWDHPVHQVQRDTPGEEHRNGVQGRHWWPMVDSNPPSAASPKPAHRVLHGGPGLEEALPAMGSPPLPADIAQAPSSHPGWG